MKDEDFKELLQSVQQGGEILKGTRRPSRVREYAPIDISGVRAKLNLSQTAFAALLGVSVRTLQEWEQGRRAPRGPAVSLLRVAEKHPEALLDSLAA